jgi:hypothetical protein
MPTTHSTAAASMSSRAPVLLLVLLFVAVTGCHKGQDGPTDSNDIGISGPGVFKFSPLDLSDFFFATPLGNLNPPGHTMPSDHVYLYWVSPDHRTPGDMDRMRIVRAPGSGRVNFLIQPSGPGSDYKIGVKMTNTFMYYLDHVMLDSGITLGSTLQAGQRVGTTSLYSYAVDLGVMNYEITLTGFVNRARYTEETIHTDSPYKYFEQPLRDSLYARVTRTGPDKDGKIDFDIPGRLVGGWFLRGLPLGEASQNPSAWSQHLAFVYDMNNPTAARIAIGGRLTMQGVYGIMQPAPDPSTISTGSGKIGYKLISPFDFPNISLGLLVVQMIANDTIKIETFRNLNADNAPFDSSAAIYTR